MVSLPIFLSFASIGALLVNSKDVRNHPRWIGSAPTDSTFVFITADVPAIEKPKSLKLTATVKALVRDEQITPVKGRIIVYFRKPTDKVWKDSLTRVLSYGRSFIIKKPLNEIRNSGNPGAFDYQRYCLFKGITHQVFLDPGDWIPIKELPSGFLTDFLLICRSWVLGVLRKNIRGIKELGLAEALLIGYKDDLDPDLVQSYSNSGVVHIIAISGLHIGLVYALLSFLLKPIKKYRRFRYLVPALVILGLWLFSLMAGAQPSILRSALMFTCIVIGESLSRRTSVYNTLAFSAFILLCIDPFTLWDVGFQLSYAAVLGIVAFSRPIYNWFYFRNRWIDQIWKLNSVTLAAQVFTAPLCIYYFHQFPNYFILANLVAVPLSCVILFGEILLCAVSFIVFLAQPLGKIISFLIHIMNKFVEWIERIPFAVSDGLYINLLQVFLLLLSAILFGYGFLERARRPIRIALALALGCFIVRSTSFLFAQYQTRIIVYNIPGITAIDLVRGRERVFIGPDSLLNESLLYRFHIRPVEILHRIRKMPLDRPATNSFGFGGIKILIMDSTTRLKYTDQRPEIDLLVLSKNPKLYMSRLLQSLDIRQVVIDPSVPAWKAAYWRKDCDSLGIPCHDISRNGAFVMRLR